MYGVQKKKGGNYVSVSLWYSFYVFCSLYIFGCKKVERKNQKVYITCYGRDI